MKTRAALLLLPPLLCGAAYFIRAKEHAALRSQMARVSAAPQPAGTRDAAPPQRESSAATQERLCRALIERGEMGPEEGLLLLKLADPPDAAQLLALAKTAASMPMEPEQRRNLVKLLASLMKSLPDREVVPVLLAAWRGAESVSDDESLPDEFRRRLESWRKEDPGTMADWLEQCVADGSLRSISAAAQRGIAMHLAPDLEGMIAPLRLIAEPVANLEHIRAADPDMLDVLFREGLRHAKTPDERRTLAAAALTLHGGCARVEALAAMVKDGGMDGTVAWLRTLPGLDPAVCTGMLADLATEMPDHGDIAKNAAGILSRLPADQQGDFAGDIANRFAERDHEAAANWINAAPAAPWQDHARARFAMCLARNGEHAPGLVWASTIGDPARRTTVTQNLLKSWQQRAPDAARQFLQSPECPPSLRQPHVAPQN